MVTTCSFKNPKSRTGHCQNFTFSRAQAKVCGRYKAFANGELARAEIETIVRWQMTSDNSQVDQTYQA